jgi:hypothetical protein
VRVPHTFTSDDPYVAQLANAIEARYPGHVQNINFIRGGVEIDIETANAIIEVKGGNGSGLGRQITARLAGPPNPTEKPVIGYSPNMGPHAAREVNNRGGIASGGWASDLETLLQILQPD